MTGKRPYTMRKRARSQERTRRRIVEAAMELHEEIGPRATTISAIARCAGVQRLTVYRHFPDERAVFEACTSHWLVLNPPPDPESWAEINDGLARTHAGLLAFYHYYRATERMWTAAFRDEAEVPALQGAMAEFRDFLHDVGDDLLSRLDGGGKGNAGLAATLHHALAFPTWASLAAQGLSDEQMAETVLRWIVGATGGENAA